MPRVLKTCQLCQKKETKKNPVKQGTAKGNETLAVNILFVYQNLECDLDPYNLGWSGNLDDHLSISEFLIRTNAHFHASCKRNYDSQEIQRRINRRDSVASAPIVQSPDLSHPIEVDSPVAKSLTDGEFTPSSVGSVWTPNKRKMDCSHDPTGTPNSKRSYISKEDEYFNSLLEIMKKECKVYSTTQLLQLYNSIVTDDVSDEHEADKWKFSIEKLFLSSMKTYISDEVHIEHDGKWRNTLICAKSSIHVIMKQVFDLSNSTDFVTKHPGLQSVRNSILNCTADGKFTGSFSKESIYENAAPEQLRHTISFLCYGVPTVDSFDVLTISNSIYYNHRKRPSALKVVG